MANCRTCVETPEGRVTRVSNHAKIAEEDRESCNASFRTPDIKNSLVHPPVRLQEAVKYGDECWSRVLMNWENWRTQGLTQHRNWWPDVYRDACKHRGVEPDAEVLAYNTTYQTVRADLKELTGSA